MTDHELSCYIVGRQNHNVLTNQPNRVYRLRESSSQSYPKLLLGLVVQEFAAEVYDKALKAQAKYGFNELGWASPDWQEELQRGIAEHLQKGDPRDVAVYSLFAWFHGWSTAAPAPAAALSTTSSGDAAPLTNLAAYKRAEVDANALSAYTNVLAEARAGIVGCFSEKDDAAWCVQYGRRLLAALEAVEQVRTSLLARYGKLRDETDREGDANGRGEMSGLATALSELAVALGSEAKSTPPAATPLVSSRAPAEWVPVGERMPEFADGEMSIECIVLGGGHRVTTATYRRNLYAGTEKGRLPRWEKSHRLYVGATITHWQPLPTAPANA